MAKLYHISEDGIMRECKAKEGNCYLGVHFDSKEKGEQFLNKVFEDAFFGNKDINDCLIVENQIEIFNKKTERKDPYSVAETMKRTALVEIKIKEALANQEDTYSKFYNQATGTWSTERVKIHNKILKRMEEEYSSVPSDGIAIISAGLPGAGKSTVLQEVLKDRIFDFCLIDSDRLKEELIKEGACPSVDGLLPMETVALIHSESAYLADVLLKRFSSNKKNIIYDCTCKTLESTARRLNLIKQSGYDDDRIKLIHVDVSIDTSKERAKGRYRYGLNNKIQNDAGFGGRWVPLSIIDSCSTNNPNFRSSNGETITQIYNMGLLKHKPQVYDNSGSKPVEIKFDDFKKGKYKL